VSYIVVDDFGTNLKPDVLAGQVHGGIAQGVAGGCSRAASTTRRGS